MTRSPSILVAGAIAAAALIVAAIALLSLRPGPSAGDRDTTDAAAETAAPAGTPQPDPLLFTRPANLTPAVWIEQWQQRMPVNVTVKRGTKAESFGASRQNYRTYTISLTLSNNTGYAIGTAGGLYLIETTLPSATGDLLTISGGSFRRKPPEDFGGAVEFRGVAESGPTAHGFYNSQTMGERGIVSRRTGPVISIMVSNSSDPDPASFGAAAAGERLTFTSELQLLVVVPQDKQDRVVVVTPELRVSGSSGERASFRYLLTFQPDGTPLDTRLLVMSEEELLPLLRDNQTALWQRVLASPWAAQFAPEAAAPELLRLMSARGQENEGLRAASMLGLAQIRADGALAPLTTVAGDPTEAIDARIAAVQALGILGSADATPSLLGVIEGADAELVSPALRSLGRIGDRSAVPALLALIENDARGDHHAAASEALQSVVGPPDVQRLSRLAANDRARGAKQAIKLLGGIGTAEAVGALTPLYRTGADDVRRSVCEALATSDTPEALSVLRSALDDRAKDVATAAAKALAGVSSPDRTAALREALRSANVDVQRAAVQAIGANQRMELQSDLVLILRDETATDSLREEAARGLQRLPSTGTEQALLAAAGQAPTDVRVASLTSLGELKSAAAEGVVAAALNDADPKVRAAAARALARIGGDARVPELAAAVLVETDGTALAGVVDAIIRLNPQGLAQFPEIADRLTLVDPPAQTQIQRLLRYLSGEEFALPANASPAAVAQTVAQWRDWWARNGMGRNGTGP